MNWAWADGSRSVCAATPRPQFTTTVWANGSVLSGDHHEQEFTVEAPADPGVYWTEIRATGVPHLDTVSWVRSNPIYVRSPAPPAQAPPRAAATSSVAIFGGTASGWRAEHDPTSLAAVEPVAMVGGDELRFRFGLAGGASVGQVAALAFDTPQGVAAYDRLTFSIRAERPMRISVQLRAGDDQGESAAIAGSAPSTPTARCRITRSSSTTSRRWGRRIA